jgi:RNA polymerase sigma-70 factor (ECF subfamily)
VILPGRANRSVEKAEIEALVEQSYPRILRAALVMTGDPWDAEDLAQETFLQAMRSWHRFARRSTPDTWLYSILLNLRRKRLRSAQRRRSTWLQWFERERPSSRADSPEAEILRTEWRESLWAAVARLPEPQQHAVVLRYSEGLSYQQVAEILQVPIGTVKSRLHHALTALERKFKHKELAHVPRGSP